MKVIIEKITGKVLYASNINVDVSVNEIIVEVESLDMANPYYNFETKTFYEGKTIEQLIIVPSEVQLWKIRTVLKLSGLESQIESAMDQLEEPTKTAALSIWNYGTSIDRNSQTIAFIQNVLGMTDVAVDQIFIQANTLEL